MMPRTTDLTPEIQKKIVKALKEGSFFSTACEAAGVPAATGNEWLCRGRGTDSKRDDREPFASFAEAIKKAEHEAEKAAIARIQQAAKGRKYKTIKTKDAITKDGEVIPLVETTEGYEYVWQADAWYLERKFSKRWARTNLDAFEALKTLVAVGWLPEEVMEVSIDGIKDLQSTMRQAIASYLSKTETTD